MTGVLNIKPLEAKLTHDTEIFGKMDPYCEVMIGSEKVKGKTCHGGGKTPTWQDVITVHRKGEPALYIELKDEDPGKDDIIGVCQVDLTKLSNHSTNWYPVYYKQKPAGEVKLEIVFTPVAPTGDQGHHHHENHQSHFENHPHWGGHC